ncbi:MAG TPA: nucleotide exchange factor GrpE [Caulobacter sp.]|nr:nucleotide exchange factor GrpE [Caulobacter sp.]
MTDDTAPNGHDPEIETAEEAAADDVEALKVEVAALKDQILRFAAEADNTRRRAEREMNDARAYAIQKFARDLFAVADHLSAATTHAPRDFDDQAVKNFVVGVEMTQKELSSVFERNGLKKIEPEKGGKFDPHLHQAMMEAPGEGVPPGMVIKTLQAGYELFGRVVRPAMVVVAAKGAPAEAAAAPAQNPYADKPENEGGSVDTKA